MTSFCKNVLTSDVYTVKWLQWQQKLENIHTDRQTDTHNITLTDKTLSPARTAGVNVKASTLQGHTEPQIHLCLDSSRPLANKCSCRTHTYCMVIFQKHAHTHD